MPSALMCGPLPSCLRHVMKAIEAVISDASSLQPEQDDEGERPLSDGSEDDPDALADEGSLDCCASLSGALHLILNVVAGCHV